MIREIELELCPFLVPEERRKHGDVSGSPFRKTMELVTVSDNADAHPERRKLLEIS